MSLAQALLIGLVVTGGTSLPLKAGLSFKDKLALELSPKHALKGEVKTAPPSTMTTTTTTSTPQARPQYVDATLFRHQVTRSTTSTTTTPATPSTTSTPTPASDTTFPTTLSAVQSSPATRDVGKNSPTTRADATSTTTSVAKSPSTTTAFYDYEGHFRLWDDLSPFGGELGILGDDLAEERYIGGFRPLGL